MKKEKRYNIIIGVMCFVIAASICVQYRSVQSFTTSGEVSVQSMAENKLRDQILKEQENYNKLQLQAQLAQEKLEKLRKDAASNSGEAAALEEELTKLNQILGYSDVKGKGLTITLKDSEDKNNYTNESIIHDMDLVEVVNELFNAGADAISINGQRIISSTAISCNGNIVRINNEKITVPFVIKAIGSPDGLYGTMMRPRGYLEILSEAGIKVDVKKVEKNELEVPKYTGSFQYKYLQIAE